MNCKYCGSVNPVEEHRCTRCGRRLQITAVSQSYPASRSAPAFALTEQPSVIIKVEEPPLPPRAPTPQNFGFADLPGSKIIPFETFAAHRIQPLPSPPVKQSAPATRTNPGGRVSSPAKSAEQAGLDFLIPPPQGPRTLKTQVEAVIYCDADVAAPMHRLIAAGIDGGMIFIGFGLFLFAFHLMGGMFRFNRQTIPFFIGVFGTLAMFYGILWIWAGRQTLGMRWTGLRLVDFDGFPAGRRHRLVRSIGACLSLCAGGIGLLWALVDEEKLAWHDHMSKTFPTVQESNSRFCRTPWRPA